MMTRLLIACLSTFLIGAEATFADNIRSVKPEVYIAPLEKKLPASQLKLAGLPRETTAITLPPLADNEVQALRNNNRKNSQKRLQVGFGRDLSAGDREQIRSHSLAWVTTEDGGRAARVSVTSPKASALRLGLNISRMDEGVELRFFGSRLPDQLFGPITAKDVATQGPIFWAPVTAGDTAVMEIYIPSNLTPKSFNYSLPQLSHLVIAPEANTKSLADIGQSDFCERDLVCVNPGPALKNAASAVAKMIYTGGGFSYLCTGTLLNDAVPGTFVPYVYTANHCLDSQALANTLNTYFFFEAATCGRATAPNFKQLTGGAQLLHSNAELDSTLIRLNNSPPSGVVFAGWDAAPVAAGAPATALHHPWGDLKKISTGSVTGYGTFEGRGSFLQASWTMGSTESGSSGSGLFTFDGSNYVLRGGLLGGTHSCSFPSGIDSYSRLDSVYPFIQQYIAAAAPTTQIKDSMEFYNTVLNHYFMTADTAEATGIENGAAGAGWLRTNQNFKIWPTLADASGNASAVCRFYTRGANSHFYTVDIAECQGLKDLETTQRAEAQAQGKSFAGWQFEGVAYFVRPSSGGTCTAGTQPVYRAYNNRAAFNDSNHRFTINSTIYQQMINSGWIAEGVVMCAPT